MKPNPSFMDISNLQIPPIPDTRLMKSVMFYLETNYAVDYRKILQDGKALKTLDPQILNDLQSILKHENFKKENQENNIAICLSEKFSCEDNLETEPMNKSQNISNTTNGPIKNSEDQTPFKETITDSQKKRWWTPQEVNFIKLYKFLNKNGNFSKDEELTKLVEKYGVLFIFLKQLKIQLFLLILNNFFSFIKKPKNWKKISSYFKERTDVQCLHRWQKVLNPSLVKGPWTKEEDEIVMRMVEKCGPRNWSNIAKFLPGRIGKQCRERWHNHLNPFIKKERWSEEEDSIIVDAHKL